MRTVRLVREVTQQGNNGPANGMYAIQHFLRENQPEWFEIGGEPQPGEVIWWWSWMDRERIQAWDQQGQQWIQGPNLLFHWYKRPCPPELPAEDVICRSPNCLLHFTESQWYADLINRHRTNTAPLVLWHYPIYPLPDGPLHPDIDVLIYAKSGWNPNMIESLEKAWPRTKTLYYGQFERRELQDAARRARACIYLSDNDRGPLALAEILLCGCQAIGIPMGAPWIVHGVNGASVSHLDATEITMATDAVLCNSVKNSDVRDWAKHFFDGTTTAKWIYQSIQQAVQ